MGREPEIGWRPMLHCDYGAAQEKLEAWFGSPEPLYLRTFG